MRISRRNSAFALAITMVLMALILVVVVAYLANTRTDRSTSSLYANRIRAKIVAEDGLAAATKLLVDNTRYGNYITAMPPPAPSPASLYTEVYRPTLVADTTKAVVDDFLKLTNAAGDILASRAATPTGTPQVDPRPTPVMIPSGGPFTITNPGFTAADSYDFNQIVRLGTNASGRLVYPSPTPAYAQWVRVRNSNNELVGRYAFFMEDESMKTNVNVNGNNLGTGSAHLRINDLTLPLPATPPATQIQEVDPAAVLPTTADRVAADTALTGLGAAGSRLASRSSVALLPQWDTNYPDVAHLVTALSRDDDTTAKGWQRLDLNALVASTTDNVSKIAVAQRIANWMRDAWTGPLITGLQGYQMFNDPRLRLQMAANIIDYIDADSIPTDLGNYPSIGTFPVIPTEYPVIGIEKLPYLAAVEVIYQGSASNGSTTAALKMKIQFRFVNLYETNLDLAANVGRIEVQGVPVISKGGTVFDESAKLYSIPIATLTPVVGSGYNVPMGTDGSIDSGAKTFTTGWLEDRAVTYSGATKPVLLAGKITAKVFSAANERLDDTAIVTNVITTGYQAPSSGNNSVGDFLKDATTTAYQTASINLLFSVPIGSTSAINFGDPRVRGTLLTDRWYNALRSDASIPVGTNRIDLFIDKAELLPRTFGFDWCDASGNRPLSFIRNGPMRSVGELGNVTASEYPWRTIYLQYPERLANTTQVGPTTDIPLRRNASVDHILMDLFRTQTTQPRVGALNINTQQRFGTQQHPLAPLFMAELIGTQPSLTQIMVDRLCQATGSATISPIFDRRIAAGAPPDNNPLRPFFQIGDLASVVSRMVNSSTNTTTGSPSRSTVTYSMLRNTPTTASETNLNFRVDHLAEQEYREISNSITTRGNVFRVLYVGQSVKDINTDGIVTANEVQAEFLAEAFVERQATFVPEGINPDAMKTLGSNYKVLSSRVVTQ
ncbi:MAG: hypothetical protein ABIR38_09960 [Chthoniobacterales bacterium]